MKKFISLFFIILFLGLNLLFAIDSCDLQSLGLSNYNSLFSGLKEPPKSDEDLGRYIGFGWRKFDGGIVLYVYKSIFGTGCYSIYKDAKILCNTFEKVLNSSKNIEELKNNIKKLYNTLPVGDQGRKLVGNLYDSINSYKTGDVNSIIKKVYNNILKIRQYYQYRAIKVVDDSIYIPYTYLIPLNITYNRSIQNLSSYYTDIGYVWLVMWIIIVLGFFYSIIFREKFLFTITLVSLGGYFLWWFVGSGILWYGIGIIIWTILSVTATLYYFVKNSSGILRNLYLGVIGLIVIFFLGQLFLNFIRISSQGGSGPFAWYKNNLGKVTIFDDFLNTNLEYKFPYTRKDVFNLQFSNYTKFLNAVNNRLSGENVFLAGTYARYFIKNQKGILYDQMLVNLRKRMSDWNTCKTYLRLHKAKGFKYISIDPNIGTVTDFNNKGNKTLFDRFYGNINLDTWQLDERGVLTFLGKMFEDGYVKYFYSNDLAAKYGFVLSDKEIFDILKKINSNINNLTEDDFAIIRGSLVAIRYPWVREYISRKYFGGDQNKLFNFIIQIALYRINNYDFITDIADYYGKNNIDPDKIKTLSLLYFKGDINNFKKGIVYLNNDEKMILASFLNIVLALKKGNSNLLQDIVFKSIASSSQIFVLQLK